MQSNKAATSFLCYFNRKNPILFVVVLFAAIVVNPVLIYVMTDAAGHAIISGVLISLVASSCFAIFTYIIEGYKESLRFSSVSKLISGKKYELNISFVVAVFKFREECLEVLLEHSGFSYEHCFQQPEKEGRDKSVRLIHNQPSLVARDDVEAITNLSNVMWERFRVVPSVKDYTQALEYGPENEISGIKDGNYIVMGLFGNSLTEFYCAQDYALFQLSEQEGHHGSLSVKVRDSRETDFEQVTDYPVDSAGKKIVGAARGLDYGIICRHTFNGNHKKRNVLWIFGGLAGPGTLAASKYFQENYEYITELVENESRKNSIADTEFNFVIVVATDRQAYERTVPEQMFVFSGDQYSTSVMLRGRDENAVEDIKNRTRKHQEETLEKLKLIREEK